MSDIEIKFKRLESEVSDLRERVDTLTVKFAELDHEMGVLMASTTTLMDTVTRMLRDDTRRTLQGK